MLSRLARSLLAASAGLALVAAPSIARAQQVDTNPPLPDVLLLIDNSGSMERMIDANTQEAESPCNCVDNNGTITCNWLPTTGVNPNRWNTLVQALTGPLATTAGNSTFNCVPMSRATGTTFASEYQIGGVTPYDTGYYLPYHRMVAYDNSSGTPAACVYAPGYLPGAANGQGVGPLGLGTGTNIAATSFLTNATPSIVTRPYGSQGNSAAPTCQFNQLPTGAIGTMSTLMRFAMMTFDSDPSPAIGVTTGTTPDVLPLTAGGPFVGSWSYYPGWSTGAACLFTGSPIGCATPSTMAVGARNPAAPPWEGRMVYFPTTNSSSAQATNNTTVQDVILATRPYGATPMAGMFRAAQYFYGQNLSSADPSPGAPAQDVLASGGCRKQYIIFMTDGSPNLDLQPNCTEPGIPGGTGCPFALPYAPSGSSPQGTAASMYNNGTGNTVETFVIGFAVSQDQTNGGSTLLGCSQFAQGQSYANLCNCTNPNLPAATYPAGCVAGSSGCQTIGPCCVLQCLAENGGSTNAYFADNATDLQTALGQILAQITRNASTRTTPAYSSSINSASTTDATSTFLASFNPGSGQAWSGDIQRQRYACTGGGLTMVAQPITSSQGDDFAADLASASGSSSNARTFIAFQPAATQPNGSSMDSTAIIRPFALTTGGDGLGQYQATTWAGSAASVIGNGSNSLTPAALNITGASTFCQYRSVTTGAAESLATSPNTPSTCMQMILDYTFATAFTTGPTDFLNPNPQYNPFTSRLANPLGDILDAEPAIVAAPGSLVEDPTYEAFQTNSTARKQVVYAATNDGLLHAFWADVTSLTNNELWAMLPPAVMTNLGSTYPSNHAALLDGSPVVKDVVWDRSTGTDGGIWHTTLVAGFGPSFAGYYAVDVTNPIAVTVSGKIPTDDPDDLNPLSPTNPVPAEGPVFRWQLTKMPTGSFQIFEAGATPAVTTLNMDPGDGGGAREIGVAILPGGISVSNGIAASPTTPKNGAAGCARAQSSDPSPTGYAARTTVNCWGSTGQATDPVPGRAVAIVRLDTGQILRVFGRNSGTYPDFPTTTDLLYKAGIVTNTPLDSPMTGTPIIYPNQVGADTTKAFISDADGTIWRFDLSSTNPANWSGQLYLDLYNQGVDTSSTAWSDGQPVVVPPVLSLDNTAELVLNVATGGQTAYTNTGKNYVYSITEKAGSSAYQASVNWYLDLTNFQPIDTGDTGGAAGQRVSGPMTVFNGNLYFASFAAAASTTSCNLGTALLWGMNYNTAVTTAGQGGTPSFTPPGGTNIQDNYNPFSLAPSATGVIPGVSVLGTPSCVQYPSTPQTDQYVAGAMHYTPSEYTPPANPYSLNVQIGGTTKTSQTTLSIPLPTPTSPTMIDSWAAILE